MKLPEGVVLLDSLGDLKLDNASPILVCGSHCGGNRSLAQHVSRCGVRAVFLNNAGVGKNQAGVRGLTHYDAENVIACAVDRDSAEIGVANDTWESGVVSHVSPRAVATGIQIGDSVKVAVAKIDILVSQESASCADVCSENAIKSLEDDDKVVDLKQQVQVSINGLAVTVADSITFLNASNAGDIVVCGSHGGVSAGHYAQKHGVKAVFFNDAGIGKNDAGTKSLEALNDIGILACAVDCMSAEIFNGQDALNNGVISVCNELAKSDKIEEGMLVKEALVLI